MDVPTDIRIIGLRNLYRTYSRSGLVYKVTQIQETTTARAHKSEDQLYRSKTWHGLKNRGFLSREKHKVWQYGKGRPSYHQTSEIGAEEF